MSNDHTIIIVLLVVTVLLQLYSLYCKDIKDKKEDYGNAGPGQSCSSGSDCSSKKCDNGKCT